LQDLRVLSQLVRCMRANSIERKDSKKAMQNIII
jgi:hypothetical protein